MTAFLHSLEGLTDRLWRVSAQTSLVIVLVLLVQWLAGNRLSPRVRYALWLVVVLRLLLPVSLESSFSLFNFTRSLPAKVFQAVGGTSKASTDLVEVKNGPAPVAPVASAPASRSLSVSTGPAAAPGGAGVSPAAANKAGGTPALLAAPPPTQILLAATTATASTFPWSATLSLAWLGGVVFLLVRIIWIPRRLNARLARDETPTSPAVFAVLDEAKRLSGVNRVLPIVQSRAVESPALLGFIRPWLLLPEGLVEKFTAQELRLVFLHELAHLKRRDIAVNWLTTLLQILHWPNPLVWLAFARMRADRELACDELALSFASVEENTTYGHAIVKLLEGYARPAALPGIVGILEDQTQMQRRIIMIAQFKKITGWTTTAVVVVLGLGLVTLTDAQTESSDSKQITPLASAVVRTLVSSADDVAFGVVSPDETAIAYVEWGTKGGALMLKDLRSGETRTLVAVPERSNYPFADDPLWSPDSQSIAYSWYPDGDKVTLRIISRQGGQPRILKREGEEQIAAFDWSRDGKMLVGRTVRGARSQTVALATLSIATGEIVPLVKEGGRHPRFSPDSKSIVYEQSSDNNYDLFVVTIDGQRSFRVTDSPAADRAPIFSPDGRHVLFSSNRTGAWVLWAVQVEDAKPAGEAFPLKYDFGDYDKMITAAGSLVFATTGNASGRAFSDDVYLIDTKDRAAVATSKPVLATRVGFGRNYAPAWSTDGKRIAFLRARGGLEQKQPQLCVQNVETGREETFDLPTKRWNRVYWVPNGKSLLLLDGAGASSVLSRFVLETQRLATLPIGAVVPLGFSRDGKEIFVVNKERKRLAIDVETLSQRAADFSGELGKLIENSQTMGGEEPRQGPMRAFAVKQEKETQLLVADEAMAQQHVIARAVAPAEFGMPSLSPDGTKVAYLRAAEGNARPRKLHIAAADGSWNEELNTGKRIFYGSVIPGAWSADSTKFAVTLRETHVSQLCVLSNFMPERLGAN